MGGDQVLKHCQRGISIGPHEPHWPPLVHVHIPTKWNKFLDPETCNVLRCQLRSFREHARTNFETNEYLEIEYMYTGTWCSEANQDGVLRGLWSKAMCDKLCPSKSNWMTRFSKNVAKTVLDAVNQNE